MRTIVHLSDLHFGRLDPRMVAPLVAAVDAVGPDLVAVSGDLTQRARRSQFADAHAFLAALRFPRLVVPGNHDVPLYDIFTRFLRPLARYRRFIAADLEPVFADEEIIVIGLNSARSLTFGRGRLNALQIARARERLREAPSECHQDHRDAPPLRSPGRLRCQSPCRPRADGDDRAGERSARISSWPGTFMSATSGERPSGIKWQATVPWSSRPARCRPVSAVRRIRSTSCAWTGRTLPSNAGRGTMTSRRLSNPRSGNSNMPTVVGRRTHDDAHDFRRARRSTLAGRATLD